MAKRSLDELKRESGGTSYESVVGMLTLGTDIASDRMLSTLAGRTPLTGYAEPLKHMRAAVASCSDGEETATMHTAVLLLAHAQSQNIIMALLTTVTNQLAEISLHLAEQGKAHGADAERSKPKELDASLVTKFKEFYALSSAQLMENPVERVTVGNIVARYSVFCTFVYEYICFLWRIHVN